MVRDLLESCEAPKLTLSSYSLLTVFPNICYGRVANRFLEDISGAFPSLDVVFKLL